MKQKITHSLAILLILVFFAFTNLAITIRHDREDSRYLKLGKQFTAVCALGRAGDGTLIAPNWILTAAHVANGLKNRGLLQAICGNVEYEIERVFIHPEWVEMGAHDIALLKLKTAVVGIKPIAIYPNSNELSQIATIAGHGDTRTGIGGKWISDGKLRAATSRIDRVDEKWIYLTFDEPPTATDLEGAPGRGDSGGPAILFVKNKPNLAGISSLGTDGKNGPATYGAEDSFVHVSSFKTWIDRKPSRVCLCPKRGSLIFGLATGKPLRRKDKRPAIMKFKCLPMGAGCWKIGPVHLAETGKASIIMTKMPENGIKIGLARVVKGRFFPAISKKGRCALQEKALPMA